MLRLFSNPEIAQQNAFKYLGSDALLYESSRKGKKYEIFDKTNKKWVQFGQLPYEDFTKHQDLKRRANYLKRTEKIKGSWANNLYSPNNLSRNILWQ